MSIKGGTAPWPLPTEQRLPATSTSSSGTRFVIGGLRAHSLAMPLLAAPGDGREGGLRGEAWTDRADERGTECLQNDSANHAEKTREVLAQAV